MGRVEECGIGGSDHSCQAPSAQRKLAWKPVSRHAEPLQHGTCAESGLPRHAQATPAGSWVGHKPPRTMGMSSSGCLSTSASLPMLNTVLRSSPGHAGASPCWCCGPGLGSGSQATPPSRACAGGATPPSCALALSGNRHPQSVQMRAGMGGGVMWALRRRKQGCQRRRCPGFFKSPLGRCMPQDRRADGAGVPAHFGGPPADMTMHLPLLRAHHALNMPTAGAGRSGAGPGIATCSGACAPELPRSSKVVPCPWGA